MGWEGLYPLKAQPGSEPRTAAVFWKARKEGRERERDRRRGGQGKAEEGRQGVGAVEGGERSSFSERGFFRSHS